MAQQLFHVSNPIRHPTIDPRAVDTFLPKADPDPDRRAKLLAEAQKDYEFDWNTENATGVPLLKDLPVRDYFSIKWLSKSAEAFGKIEINEALPPFHRNKDRGEKIDDFADLFVIIDDPAVVRGGLWATDESFAEQRLSGANPMSIRKVDQPSDVDGLLPPTLNGLLGSGTIEQEIAAGRLFFVDHRSTLAPIQHGGSVELDKVAFEQQVPKTAALFWWHQWNERLMPVSVLIDGPDPTLVTPTGDKRAWIAAKLAFQAADGIVHEMSTHLGRTHLVMGGIAISAKRRLAESHPIHRLLLPHYRFMLALNQLAERTLIAPGGDLDVSFGAPIAEIVAVAAHAYASWDFTADAYPNDIVQRGVGKSAGLPTYAYRDDAALLWAAIEEYAGEYVSLYYKDDSSVAADPELKAWSKEIGTAAPAGAGIQGFPALDTIDSLVFSLANIIFTCSAQHSAVNFSQQDYLSFAPNSPFASWSTPTSTDMLALLPPMGPAEGQLSIVRQLTAFHYDELGDYSGKYTRDARANLVTNRFFEKMVSVDQAIAAHQADRWQSYEYLRPKNVLNSISM